MNCRKIQNLVKIGQKLWAIHIKKNLGELYCCQRHKIAIKTFLTTLCCATMHKKFILLFAWQQISCKHATMLRYTYAAYLVH